MLAGPPVIQSMERTRSTTEMERPRPTSAAIAPAEDRWAGLELGGALTPEDAPACRICLGDAADGTLFSPCKCKGSMKYVHVHCLQRWRAEGAHARAFFECGQCKYRYNLRRVEVASLSYYYYYFYYYYFYYYYC